MKIEASHVHLRTVHLKNRDRDNLIFVDIIHLVDKHEKDRSSTKKKTECESIDIVTTPSLEDSIENRR